jgi:hypothetical protein
MIQKADIVTFKGLDSSHLGLVDKIVEIDGTKHAVIRWIKPFPNQRTFAPAHRFKTLRTAKEAGSRGRKKQVSGLLEGSDTYATVLVKEEVQDEE